MMVKKALITGITGQDGSYLAELLLSKGYKVFGIIRRSSSFNTERIDHIYQDPHESGRHLNLVYGDLIDASSLNKILRTVNPDEIYNLGSQSHFRVRFDVPEYTADVDGLGTLRIMEALREGAESITCRGTGCATREFLHADDCAEGIQQATEQYDKPDKVNLGAGFEITISDLVSKIARLTGFKGRIEWDSSQPDGQPRRGLDVERASLEFNCRARIGFDEGLRQTIEWYQRQLAANSVLEAEGPKT